MGRRTGLDLSITMLYRMWAFNQQANQKLLQVLRQIPEATLQETSSPSRGSLWRLVIHIVFTEEHFIRCCRGETYQRQMLKTVDQLQHHWQTLHLDALEYLQNASTGELQEVVGVELGGRQFHFSRWEMLLQAVTHSIQHRGELSMLLSSLGHPLPNMDLIVYLAEIHKMEWPWQ